MTLGYDWIRFTCYRYASSNILATHIKGLASFLFKEIVKKRWFNLLIIA